MMYFTCQHIRVIISLLTLIIQDINQSKLYPVSTPSILLIPFPLNTYITR